VRPPNARLFAVGSILGKLPPRYTGYVWGTGKMKDTTPVDLTRAKVLAVRGPLSWPETLHADPGLLVGRFAPQVEKRFKLGVVPHYIEPLPHEGHLIDIQSGIENVIRQAAMCERIVTSSLHALILADSLGIPNQWIYSEKVIGSGFKFRDYTASFGETIEPEVWRLAPQDQVADKQEALIRVLAEIKG
jgi:pyruvyltransferase